MHSITDHRSAAGLRPASDPAALAAARNSSWLCFNASTISSASCGLIPWSLIDRRLARRARLPASVNPQPLIGIFANRPLKCGVHALRVFENIAAHRNLGIEAQNIALLSVGPKREARNHGRSAVMRELHERRVGAGFDPEEIDEHAFLKRRILIDQDPHRLARQILRALKAGE